MFSSLFQYYYKIILTANEFIENMNHSAEQSAFNSDSFLMNRQSAYICAVLPFQGSNSKTII